MQCTECKAPTFIQDELMEFIPTVLGGIICGYAGDEELFVRCFTHQGRSVCTVVILNPKYSRRYEIGERNRKYKLCLETIYWTNECDECAREYDWRKKDRSEAFDQETINLHSARHI